MTGFLVVFILALCVLAVFIYAARRHAAQLRSLEDFRARWKQVDIEAFANLIDPTEERFLHDRLPPAEFRRLQRQRIRVTREYLGRVSLNAQLMVQAGQIVQRHNAGPESERARSQVNDAMRLRGLIFQAQVGLTMQLLLPGYRAPLERVLSIYADAAHSFDNALAPNVNAHIM